MGFESDWSFNIKQVKPGAEVKFQCYALHTDRYVAPAVKDLSLEYPVTLAQGIANGKHTLVLTTSDPLKTRLKSLRVYRPPVAAATAMVYETVRPAKCAGQGYVILEKRAPLELPVGRAHRATGM